VPSHSLTTAHPPRLSQLDPDGRLDIGGCPPSIQELIGTVGPTTTPSQGTAHPPGNTTAPDGQYLTPRHAELMQEALWENLEQAKRRREWRDHSIAERKAKKSKLGMEELEVEGPQDHGPTTLAITSSSSTLGSTATTSATRTPGPMDVDSTDRVSTGQDASPESPRSKGKGKERRPRISEGSVTPLEYKRSTGVFYT